MPVRIKSYYKTTPMTDELLGQAIRSARDQENKIFHIFKKYGCMTMWDVYDVYNTIVAPIIPSSVGRSIVNLKKQNIIYSIGTITCNSSNRVDNVLLTSRNKTLSTLLELLQVIMVDQ